MGEESPECEFWLPPQFLNDDDMFMGFKGNSKEEENERKRYFGFGSDFVNEFSYGFNMFAPKSDLSSPVDSLVGSSETESDEEEFFTELTRQMAHATLENHKVQNLSTSPQSTLCGVLGSKQGSNSETPNSPELQSRKGTVDLLYAAVGEVARMKKMEEEVGICHHKNGIWAPPRQTNPAFVDSKMSKPNVGSFYSNQPPPPPLSYQQFKMAQFQLLKQQQIMKQRHHGVLGQEKDGFWEYHLSQNNQQLTHGRDRNVADNRPLNKMAMSVWPTLQQAHHHQQKQQPTYGSGVRGVGLGNVGPKRECAGTGVFIPRRAGTQTETKKKQGGSTVLLPDRVVQALNLNLQSQVQPRFNNGGVLKYQNNNVAHLRKQPTAMSQEHQLPQEWTY
ncbi:uncharacterized protein LOC107852917 [Capsicum annuum]|uniref:uncharacterized protein LOC107852917 n=1 Tax=Capsicum annuum TaxID=4072 RepID=UPI0007BF5F17|nr:uncharacterized protein LOC107852917 [Capsicum annuum]